MLAKLMKSLKDPKKDKFTINLGMLLLSRVAVKEGLASKGLGAFQIFEDIFGAFGEAWQRESRGDDLRYDITIDLRMLLMEKLLM